MDAPRTGRYGTASPAPDGLRVGDAERDEVVAALREHFAEGRLDREEFDLKYLQCGSGRARRGFLLRRR